MKKLLFYTLLICFTSSLFADNNKTAMTKEEFMQKIMALEQRKKDAIAKTETMKRETESIKRVGRKLDEILGVLSENK